MHTHTINSYTLHGYLALSKCCFSLSWIDLPKNDKKGQKEMLNQISLKADWSPFSCVWRSNEITLLAPTVPCGPQNALQFMVSCRVISEPNDSESGLTMRFQCFCNRWQQILWLELNTIKMQAKRVKDEERLSPITFCINLGNRHAVK